MNDMVQRVAKAIWEKEIGFSDYDLEDWEDAARAAIVAMPFLEKLQNLRGWAERWASDEPHGGPHTTLVQIIADIDAALAKAPSPTS